MGARKVKLGRVSDVDIRLLRIFKTVVESGGLAAAEVELGIGRSTISTHLADLETRLGTRLCDRGRSGFSLTAHGHVVYQALNSLMKSLDDFQQDMAELHGYLSGELNVGLADNLIWDPQLNLVSAFRRLSKADEVSLNVYVLSPDEIEKRLLDGSLSVGLTPVMHHSPALEYHMIFEEQSYLYCGRDHPLFDTPDAAIDDTTLRECSYVRKGYAVNSEFRETNDTLSHHISAHHVEAIALLILTGAHIGFLPMHYAANWVRSGEMRAIRPGEWRALFEFGAVLRKGRSPSAVQTEFVAALIEAVAQNN